jgi:tetratricopeptide (TPR) repeat protein
MVVLNPTSSTSTPEIDAVLQNSLPKVVKWMGIKVTLGEPSLCMQRLGLTPGTILIPTNPANPKPYEILGIGQFDNYLWIRERTGLRKVVPLTNIQNQEDIKNRGFSWITYLKQETNQGKIADTSDLVACMRKMFREQKNCDVFFIVGEKQIGGHTSFLQNSCDYFRGLFAGDFKEGIRTDPGQPRMIRIEGCDLEEFEILLEYVYTRSIEIDEDNILMVAHAADFFQIDALIKHSRQRMTSILKPDRALCYYHEVCGRNFFLVPLITRYIFENFTAICQQDQETISQLPQETLEKLLQEASAGQKAQCFEALMIWIKHHPKPLHDKFDFIQTVLPLLPQEDHHLSYYAGMLASWIQSLEEKQQIIRALNSLLKKDSCLFAIFAEAFRQNGYLVEAKTIFKALIDHFPHFGFALSRYAALLSQEGNWPEAKIFLDRALKAEPRSAFTLSYYAQALLQLGGELQVVRKKFEEAILVNKEQGESICNSTLFSQYAELVQHLSQDGAT